MPIVRVPDGRLVRFPDDMPRAEIRGIINSKFALEPAPIPEPEPEETSLFGYVPETFKALGAGAAVTA